MFKTSNPCRILGLFVLLTLFVMTFPSDGFTYDPPIGIPAPSFGIDETVESVYGDPGYYTHWVDNTHPNASNDNGNGTPEYPLLDPFKGANSITLPEGSVMVIEGGPYSYSGWKQFICEGTTVNPVIVRGSDPVNRVIYEATDGSADLRIVGSYLILENIDFQKGAFPRMYTLTVMPDHISIRNNEIHAEGMYVSVGSAVSGAGSDVVVYNNHIHDMWKGADLDCHGTSPGAGSQNYWVLDNHIHNNSGDGFQATHGASSNPPKFVYVGRNIFHDDRENAVDLKYVEDIVISENICYGYEQASTSDGVAMVIGSDGAPTRPWVIFNEIYDSNKGIRIEEVGDAWFIGNRIYNIVKSAFPLEKQGTNLYIIGNSIHNADNFINQFWMENFTLHVYNNIVSDMVGNDYSCHMNIESSSVYNAATFENNLFWQSGSEVVLNLGHGTNTSLFEHFNTTADFDALPFGANNIIENPYFTDAANGNLDLLASSAAIDSGVYHSAYDTFYSLYGINIQIDYKETARPQGSEWDIGAHEYSGGGPMQYSLTVNISGSGSVTLNPPGGIYVENTVVTLTANGDPGFQFDDWTGDLTGIVNPETILMDSNKNVTANFSQIPGQYILTVNISGSGSVTLDPAGGVYSSGTVVTLTASADVNWQFDSWSGDLTSTSNPETITMDANKTVTANFTLINPPVELTVSSVTASSSENPNVPENTLDNDLATRWSSEGDGQWIRYDLGSINTISYLSIAVHQGDIRITYFDIEISNNAVDWTQVYAGQSSGTTLEQEIYDFTDMTGRYARIVGHGNSGNMWNSITEVDIYGFVGGPTQYSLTTNTSGSGSIVLNPAGGIYDDGTIVTVTANPSGGWLFGHWSGDLSGSVNPTTITMNSNKIVTATFGTENWIINSIASQTDFFYIHYDAKATADDVDGVIGFSENSPTIYDDQSCKVLFNNTGAIQANNGSTFQADNTVNYVENQNFEVKMAINVTTQTYSVWVTPEGGSETAIGIDYAFHPAPGTISAVNYRSVKMSFDVQWGGAIGMVEISNFAITTTTLSANTSGSGSIALNPSGGVYDQGTVVTLTANPDIGWQFDSWIGDLTSTDNPETITMDADKNITATFTVSGPVNDYANSDIPESGTVTSNYTDTQTSDDVYESIEEVESGGKPANRYSYLEHKWTIDVTGGNSVTFYVEAYKTASSDGDDFFFAYSTNDADYTDMVTVTKTSDDNNYQTFILPNTLTGTVYIRVMDTDQTPGNRNLDIIYVDHMYICSEGEITPPAAPTSLAATAVSSSQIDLVWTDNADNEAGFKIERSDDGGQSFIEIDQVGINDTDYSDTGLSPSTEYCYQVRAFNGGGNSAYSNSDCATTQEGGGPVDDVANSDILVSGTVSGSYLDTQTSDDVYESIEEILFDHPQPKKQYNYLEHKWTINVTGGSTVTFYVEAYHTVNSEGDDFVFAYSTDDDTYIDMLTVTKTSDDNTPQTYSLPSSLSGTVYIRVMDTDQTKELTNLDIIYVDQLFIRSASAKRIAHGYFIEAPLPTEMKLYKNYPNPFNPSTTIRYNLSQSSHVKLTVYDMMGRKVSVLVDQIQNPGEYSYIWEPVNCEGTALPSGVYMCRFQIGSYIETIKMMYMR